jgi:hypothetical protein
LLQAGSIAPLLLPLPPSHLKLSCNAAAAGMLPTTLQAVRVTAQCCVPPAACHTPPILLLSLPDWIIFAGYQGSFPPALPKEAPRQTSVTWISAGSAQTQQ